MAIDHMLQVVVLCNLITTTIWIALKYERNSAIECPLHLAIYVLLSCGLLWFLFGRWSKDNGGDNRVYSKYQEVTIAKHHHTISSISLARESSPERYVPRLKKLATSFYPIIQACSTQRSTTLLLLGLYIVIRVLLFHMIVDSVQCAWDGVEIFLPFLVSLYDLRPTGNQIHLIPKFETVSLPASSVAIRYASYAGVLALAGFGTISLSSQISTYICPSTNNLGSFIHLLQVLGLFLDSGIIIGLSDVLQDAHTRGGRPWGLLNRVSISTATVIGLTDWFLHWWNRENILDSFHFNQKAVADIFLSTILCTNFLASLVYLASELRARTILTITGCISLYTYHLSASHLRILNYVPSPTSSLAIMCGIAFLAVAGLARLERDASRSQQYMSLGLASSRFVTGLFVFLGAFFLGVQLMLYFGPSVWDSHPIDDLISTARYTSADWARQALRSQTLKEAVREYRTRYGIPPPPNFDKWYEFATSRGSVIIDDFNQINEDLLPFWALSPAHLRNMTGYMIERPWNEMAGLRIQHGTTEIGPHMPKTHRWMLEGTSAMIDKFAEWLPDMDLAFNINDENRVAVPYEEMEELKRNAIIARRKLNGTKTLQSFSKDTILGWESHFLDPESPYRPDEPSAHFYEASRLNSFERWGAVGCPPGSTARTVKWWNKKLFCHDCAAPHSYGSFLSNWTLSGSLCHQPDMANLQGLLISPAAFKSTPNLFPVFSQSKVPTFNDIIYPSPWNYQDKAFYNSSLDMPFSSKKNTLFWMGSTTEAFSAGETWHGFQRQRFVHHMSSTSNSTSLNLLLPCNSGRHPGYSHQRRLLSAIREATNISVSFVGDPIRCDQSDCINQRREFSFGAPVDFQEQWKYKYLFDLDGAGFSGRFLPFLQSHSLVFRAATFRQWFDERLTAWRHFIPIDSRLHGVWGTVAYFGGVGENRRDAHDAEAQLIATEGREWAERALRKSDMEVYMFRLLLEWARIVDDRREELGFVLEDVG